MNSEATDCERRDASAWPAILIVHLSVGMVVPHLILDLSDKPLKLVLFENFWMVRSLLKDSDGAPISVLQLRIRWGANNKVRLELFRFATGNDR